mmetsp:Transcript_13387/g.28844  ORF Transcript_13387/g.28844 Transcript_13387/m.28844 type:complete len:744 (+) Transcript_13387:297-2528(+)
MAHGWVGWEGVLEEFVLEPSVPATGQTRRSSIPDNDGGTGMHNDDSCSEQFAMHSHIEKRSLMIGVAAGSRCACLSALHAGSVWNGGVRLAQLIQAGDGDLSRRVRGRSVLELGAGAALPSLVLLAQQEAARRARAVVISDYNNEAIVEAIRANVARNKHVLVDAPSRCRVVAHTWGDDVAPLLEALRDIERGDGASERSDGKSERCAGQHASSHAGDTLATAAWPADCATSAATATAAAAAIPSDSESSPSTPPPFGFETILVGDCIWNTTAHHALLQSICRLLAPAGEVWMAHCHHWPGHEAADASFFSAARDKGLAVRAIDDAAAEMSCLFGDGVQRALVHTLCWRDSPSRAHTDGNGNESRARQLQLQTAETVENAAQQTASHSVFDARPAEQAAACARAQEAQACALSKEAAVRLSASSTAPAAPAPSATSVASAASVEAPCAAPACAATPSVRACSARRLLDLPDEVLEHLGLCLAQSGGVRALAMLHATCTRARQLYGEPYTRRLAAALGSPEGLGGMQNLAICQQVAHIMERGGGRVGFQFAGVSLDNEDGTESGVPSSRLILRQWARLLLSHPLLTLRVDAHCGPTAPTVVARNHSRRRGLAVAEALAAHGVCMERVAVVAWGKALCRRAAASDHPHSGSARLGCGWAELFVILPVADADGAEPREIELPQRPDFYQGVTQPCTLQASTISDGSDCSVSDGEHETQTVFLTHSSDDEEHELTENLLSSRASDSE